MGILLLMDMYLSIEPKELVVKHVINSGIVYDGACWLFFVHVLNNFLATTKLTIYDGRSTSDKVVLDLQLRKGYPESMILEYPIFFSKAIYMHRVSPSRYATFQYLPVYNKPKL